jgi:hypothetical protein
MILPPVHIPLPAMIKQGSLTLLRACDSPGFEHIRVLLKLRNSSPDWTISSAS